MSKGAFIRNPDRRVRLLVTIQLLWVATLIVLALWWGTLLHQQSDEIASLQSSMGVPESQVHGRLERTTRMITGESGTFVVLILITNSILLFFFMRDSRRSKSLEAFFASVTHELRTPLTSIKLQAEALRDIGAQAEMNPFINRLLEDSARLEGQVEKTLELARIESGGSLHQESIAIRQFIQNKILPSYSLTERRVKFDLDLEATHILADLTALGIIFRNIIDNALKYSVSAPTEIRLQGKKNQSRYVLRITHQNSRFDGTEKELGKLFYRGKNSQGAGVGLYLIQTLMKKMGGHAKFAARDQTFTTSLEFQEDPHGA